MCVTALLATKQLFLFVVILYILTYFVYFTVYDLDLFVADT